MLIFVSEVRIDLFMLKILCVNVCICNICVFILI